VRGRTCSRAIGRCPRRPPRNCATTGSSSPAIWGTSTRTATSHIVGRNKDLIISGGYNIYPKEIELVLDDQPGVLESAVIGVPHADFGETVLGLIVAEPGATPDLDAIAAAAAARLARFKHPRKLIVIDALPRNTMGKVQKNILREAYATLFAPARG
jgi:malonyl-CoA/methylmalonyl-CoA synthetase